jgi:hypothetical protein
MSTNCGVVTLQGVSLVAARGPLGPAAAIGDVAVEDVAWSYQDPPPESQPITGYLSFDPARADVFSELPAGA